ncbi:hypothetical protein Syun_019792 [Stephania yunnanensis]|uniref:Uncharacterized protein n=1 Tax=Stephania yunnanensis TaxID=152371 RepID=A0AAP0IVY2_9MAGN
MANNVSIRCTYHETDRLRQVIEKEMLKVETLMVECKDRHYKFDKKLLPHLFAIHMPTAPYLPTLFLLSKSRNASRDALKMVQRSDRSFNYDAIKVNDLYESEELLIMSVARIIKNNQKQIDSNMAPRGSRHCIGDEASCMLRKVLLNDLRSPSELLDFGEFSDCLDYGGGTGASLHVVNPAFYYVPPKLVRALT